MQEATRCAVLITALAMVSLAFAQEEPTPPRPSSPAAQQAAFAEIEALVGRIRATRPSERSGLLDQLYAHCGAFLDAHLKTASAEQLSLAGTTWLQLAAREGDTPALRARLQALGERDPLPSDLRRLMRLHSARLTVKVGQRAPTFQVADLRAPGDLEPKRFAGKLLLVDFWARRNPNSLTFIERKLTSIHQRFKRHAGFALLSIGTATGEDRAAQLSWAKEHGMTWNLGFDAKDEAALDFGAGDVPYLVLIDGGGKILALGSGWRVVDAVVAVLAERLEPKPKQDERGEGN